MNRDFLMQLFYSFLNKLLVPKLNTHNSFSSALSNPQYPTIHINPKNCHIVLK